MQVPDWVVILMIFIALIGGVSVFFFFLNILLSAWMEYSLTRELKKGLFHNDLTLDDFKNLQKNHNLSDKNAHLALLRMKAKVDYSNDAGRSIIKPKLDGLVKEFNTNKPFSELPIGLVKPLSEAKENSNSPLLIDDLADKILIHVKRKKRIDFFFMIITCVSLILSVFGVFPNLIN